jgi:flavin reductase (DIM6/NTAB) family NADH-FMN oxidoreductase RutF
VESSEEIADQIDYPMWVVTTAAAGERSGCLVGFLTQCSIDPVRWLVCLSHANHTASVAAQASTLVVHLLRAGDVEVARHFGEETGDEVDKFAGVPCTDGPDGAPVLEGLDWFAGRILSRHDLGDHTGYLLEPIDGSCSGGSPPLGFQQVRDLDPGHDA